MARRQTDPDQAVEAAPDDADEGAVRAAQEQQNASVQAVQEAEPVAVDRVSLVSLKADLTANQTEGFQVIGDRDVAREDLETRLREQRVSYADHAARTALAGVGGAGVNVSDTEDPIIAALQDKHESAAGDVKGDASRLVPSE